MAGVQRLNIIDDATGTVYGSGNLAFASSGNFLLSVIATNTASTDAEIYVYVVPAGWTVNNHGVETYYGPGAEKQVRKRMKDLGMWGPVNNIWVEPENMWLYQD